MCDKRTLTILPSEEDVITEVCNIIENISKKAIERDDVFKVGLSGGSLIRFLSSGLPNIKTDWSKWRLFFCDERIVPIESEDSTFGSYKKAFGVTLPFTDDQFIKIDPHLHVEDAARDYIAKMAVWFSPDTHPRFHLLLLGMGPDGHTCSLFPNKPQLGETSVWVVPIKDSPKPPSERITLTFPVINNAENCIFALTGEEKSEILKRVLEDCDNQLPAARVRPTDGHVYWIMDKKAASLLSENCCNSK